jgi:NAD(P)-dependent dehydrogenase (short-subunit alcohol dehydrogenase family)
MDLARGSAPQKRAPRRRFNWQCHGLKMGNAMGELKNKVAILTGASRGLGAAAALALAGQGVKLALLARDKARLEGVASQARAKGVAVLALQADVADSAAIDGAIAQAVAALGPIDILINNAGVIEPIGLLGQTDAKQWAANIAINLVGAYNLLRAVLPAMAARGRGIVIDVSSGAAHRPLEGWSAYCSAKAGLAMLTQAAALEYGPKGVRVFGLSPGTVDTDMQGQIRASGINMVSQIPRAQLAPADLPARAIVYLCGAAASDLVGSEASLRDPAFRRRVGLD